MAFTHLHVHTEYSLLDGATRISQAPARAKELGMNALAITDHGVMYGVIDFYKACQKVGIKPIIGCEVYVAPRTRFDMDPARDRSMNHLLLLAENNEGYRNLIKIVSAGFTEGFYYKPRVDKEVLRKYGKGIIASSACLAGKVQRCLLDRDYEGAKQEALELQDIFGEGNFYLEIQDQGIREEALINPELFRLSEETGIPMICTNDVHYLRQTDAEAHDVLLAIQTASSIHDPGRMKFANDQFYLKSEQEMRSLFPDHPEIFDNTQKIADRCNVTFTFGEYHLPEFIPPEGKNNRDYLYELCQRGLEERYGEVTPELQERMNYELSVIESMGFVEYFLIVWDFIHFANENHIMVGPGRGSAAGSIVAYCLKITDIDPIKNTLIFERFLNPARVSMPDIDIDFCIERRGEVIDYVKRKYGKDNVSQIITFGTMKAKQAIRDVGRAMDVPYSECDKIAKAVPNALKMTLEKAMEISPDLRKMYEEDAQVRKVVDMARAIEGMPRHASTHAAGVVISKLPVDEYVPLYNSEKGIATQFNMTTIEELGLLKMDFLGLRNLTVIRDALAYIEQDGGPKINFQKMEYDDPKVYQLISTGNTAGVFQLESGGMTEFMKNLKPSCFEDVVAGIALYRPGPMDSIPRYLENKKDPSKISYVTPELAPILDVTYGCIIYQEQVMQIVRDLAGYDYGRSDLVRRAMSKKKTDVMAEEKEYFIHGKDNPDGTIEIMGCVRNGISEEAAEQIYAEMQSFAEYAFNKSHAAAYAVLAYETAWLKTYYPREFMAALISSVLNDSKQVSKYIRNCEVMGIEILPPDVNRSGKKFTVEGDKIRFGLLGVKHVGEKAIDEIIFERESKGNPQDIYEFIDNLDLSKINKRAVESLIKAGALDCFQENRAAHLAVYESLMNTAQNEARRNVAGQMSLFQMNSDIMNTAGARGELPLVSNFDKKTRLLQEKEMAGVYLTGHPLDEYADVFKNFVTMNAGDFEQAAMEEEAEEESLNSETGYTGPAGFQNQAESSVFEGKEVTMAGMIVGKRNLITKRNEMMAFVQVEDLYGDYESVVFPRVYDKYQSAINEDNVVVLKGRISMDGNQPKLIADSVVNIDEATKKLAMDKVLPEVKIRIPDHLEESVVLKEIQKIIQEEPGSSPVRIYRKDGKAVRAKSGIQVSDNMKAKLERLVGSENVKC